MTLMVIAVLLERHARVALSRQALTAGACAVWEEHASQRRKPAQALDTYVVTQTHARARAVHMIQTVLPRSAATAASLAGLAQSIQGGL